jgi:D-xylose transport system ATP-binding protein
MPLLEMRNIVKEFPGVRALDGVSFVLEEGEIHALVGENGAGKSTLMKVLAGVYPHGSFSGDILLRGRPSNFYNVRDSAAAGIGMIFQELSLVKEMSVAENIFLGREPTRLGVIDRHRLEHDAKALLRDLGLAIDPRVPVGRLGIGRQQLVEIAKALSQNAEIFVLDEPTAALTESEVDLLFDILRRLRERGVGMVYISHKLDEIYRIADRITILRDGATVGTHAANELAPDRLIADMVGREVGEIFPAERHIPGDVALEVRDLSAQDPGAPRKSLSNISFALRRGEVLGIAGLMGAGRTELLSALFGAFDGTVTGEILVDGRTAKIRSPADAIRSGIGFVTEDRKRTGFVPGQSVARNVTLAALPAVSGRFFTDSIRENAAAAAPMRSLGIRPNDPAAVVDTLSGGNQQKVVLAKWLLTDPSILLLDEPTRGIDVGAKQEVYAEINRLAREGLAILLVSSELPEILGLSDRILVLREGRVAAEFTREEATPELIMSAATGGN